MSTLSYDILWKTIVSELFEEFLLFFAPDLYEQVDFSKKPDFLEQELKQLFPDSADGKRYTDKLAKVYLKNGQEQWVLIHVEIQGDRDEEFAKRMFRYFYRVFEKYDQNIYSITIFTDSSKSFQPNQYNYEFYGTQLTYTYNTYKIREQEEATLQASENPFALAILAGFYVIQSKKYSSQKFNFKKTLIELLIEKQWETKKRGELFKFIDTILILPKNENKLFIETYIPIIEKESDRMGLPLEHTSFAKYFREEGLEKGREEALKESVRKMASKNVSLELIAELLEIPLSKVESWVNG